MSINSNRKECGAYEFVSQGQGGSQSIARWMPKREDLKSEGAGSSEWLERAASKFRFSLIDVKSRRHPVIANMSKQSIDVYDRYSVPCSSEATPGQGNTKSFEPVGSVNREETDDGECDKPCKTVIETDDDLRTLITITGVWVAFCENWSPNFRYSTKQVISNGISELSNRRRMDDVQPLALSADDRSQQRSSMVNNIRHRPGEMHESVLSSIPYSPLAGSPAVSPRRTASTSTTVFGDDDNHHGASFETERPITPMTLNHLEDVKPRMSSIASIAEKPAGRAGSGLPRDTAARRGEDSSSNAVVVVEGVSKRPGTFRRVHSNMSAPSRDQYNQVSNPAGSNNSAGDDTTYANTLMNPGFPAFPQPDFGFQSWSNMPLPGYNFNLPFPSDFSSNNGFFQNQQNELPDYDGNDDFYDNEMNKTDNASILPANSKHSSGSLPSQVKVTAPAKSHTETPKGPAVDPSNRAAELRAQLLANRRPGSTTPSAPRIARKELNNVKMKMGGSERENKEIDVSSVEQRPKPGEAIVMPKDSSSPQSADKSSQNPSKAQSLPTHNADIEGLIDEYRASEADKDSSLPVVGTNTSGSTNGKTNGGANGSHAVGPRTIPTSHTTVSPKTTHAGSPGSPESGEIHSDQEPATNSNQGRKNVEKVNDEPRKAAEKKITIDKSDKRQPLKTPQSRADDSKQAAVPSKSRQSSLLQNTDQRKSVNTSTEPRNVPLAQRITHVREEELPSPSLRGERNTNYHGRDNMDMDKVDNLDHQQPAKPSSVTAQSRSRLPSRTATAPRPDRHEQERKQNEDLAALYKKQLADQKTPSPRSKIVTNEGGKSWNDKPVVFHDKPNVNGTSADDSVAKPVKQHAPKIISPGKSSSDQGAHKLTHYQYEQIQKMGIDLSPQGLGDLYEFLEYHRYYVPEYREGFFARQKRLRALEAEKLALERESLLQFDHFTSMRSQSLAAREQTEPPTPVSVHRTISIETAAAKPMPPPLTLPKRASNGGIGDLPDSAGSLKSATRTNGNVTPREISQTSPSNLKRQRPDDDMDLDRSKKIARVDTDLRSNVKGQDISPRTTGHDQPTHDRRYSSDQRPAGYDLRGRSRSPNDRRRSLSAHRRPSDFSYPSRQNSWAHSREQEYPASRDPDYRRPSADGRRQDSTGHPEERKPSYSSHNHPSFPNRGPRGGSRGGRGAYQTYKPRAGYSSYAVSPAPSGWKISESVDLKAGVYMVDPDQEFRYPHRSLQHVP
ncbi:MAG: hypothetical protein L6R38_008225 [Xanthoria sp. 2 TBL-2021]|nr:MAG: hypothetical protein L6R38_008225 [Xanthoria sp. 2 TBL-2021]